MTTQAGSLLVEAARRMLHRGDDGGEPIDRNGVGFSGADYGPVRRLLWSIDRTGAASPGQVASLARRMVKYRRQLAELGYDADALLDEAGSLDVQRLINGAVGAVFGGGVDVEDDDPDEEPDDAPPPAPASSMPSMASVLGPGGVIARGLPGYESRAPQIRLAQAIADAIAAEEPLLGEAGTGVGKSLAYLAPAIYAGGKTIVSTEGKTLQDQLIDKDLPFLRNTLPVAFTYAKLKGLSNYLCLLKLEEEAGQQGMLGESDEFAALHQWVNALGADASGDLAEAPLALTPDLAGRITSTSEECLGRDCPHHAACYAMRARQAAKEADVLVVNHTLLALDLALRSKTDDGVSILPDRDRVIVDETHALDEVATKAFTAELTNWRVPSLLRGRLPALAGFEPEAMAAATEASRAFFDDLLRLVQARENEASTVLTPTPRLRELAAATATALRPLVASVTRRTNDPMLDRVDRARLERYATRLGATADLFAGILEDLQDTHVLYAEVTARARATTVAIKLAPISVADDLHAALWSRWPTVAVSATLTATPLVAGGSPFGYVRERLGCADGGEQRVESPFDFRRNALIYLPPDGYLFDPSRYRQDGSVDYFERLGDQIEQLLLAADGRAFCLFTSRRALDEVHGRIAARLRWTILRQGDAAPAELIRRFKDDGHAVLFGLRSFMTGVDVQGDALSLVVIDKLPFPSPSEPVYQARCDLLTRQTDDKWAWFTRLALPTCAMTFKQAAGRLIRTSTDRGVIALLDGRLTSKQYGATILRALPPATITRSMAAVEAFFAQGHAGVAA